MAASAYPQVSGFLLQGAFKFYPPPCTTYLLTDDDQNPNVKIFEPERETLKLARLEEDLQDEVAAHTDSEGHVHLQHDSAESLSAWKQQEGRPTTQSVKHPEGLLSKETKGSKSKNSDGLQPRINVGSATEGPDQRPGSATAGSATTFPGSATNFPGSATNFLRSATNFPGSVTNTPLRISD